MKKIISLLLAVSIMLPFASVYADTPEQKVFADTEHTKNAIAQGDTNDDSVVHNADNDMLFITDTVHHNPGLLRYKTNYTDPEFLTERGYDGKVFCLYDAAQFGLLWDKYDEGQGVVLSEEDYNADPTGNAELNNKKVYPYGSNDRKWAEDEKQRLLKAYDEAVAAGQKVYFMMDTITLPTRLVSLYPEVLSDSNSRWIDILKPKTEEVMEYLFAEMFVEFPQIEGIYIRYGENYVGPSFNTPYHRGNNPIIGDGVTYHMQLIKFLREKMCEGKYLESHEGKYDESGIEYTKNWEGSLYPDATPRQIELVYRTWGFGNFQYDPNVYTSISNKVEPHEKLYFCIKHTVGDFHRLTKFNQSLNIGNHNQIVEVQAAREYEGKGAYPNYIGDGVINGFEELEWVDTDETTNKSLRDVINTQTTNIKGVWSWSRGGGWNGPYIDGANGKEGDTTSDNREVIINDGSELWDDLNAYVVTQWAKDTSKTDKYYVKKYAKDVLGMNETDAENFYRLCILSARAVLLGRATDSKELPIDLWWTRDQNINPSILQKNIKNVVAKDKQDLLLSEKAECVYLWKEMIDIAQSFDDSVAMKDYMITTTKYGYYLFSIFEQMHIAGVYKQIGDNTGVYSTKIKDAIDEYDRLWAEWQNLFETAKGCPSLYAKENKSLSLIGYSGNSGTDSFMDPLRYSLSVNSSISIGKEETAQLSIKCSPYGADVNQFNFISTDESVATVDATGTVTGVSAGVARILTVTKDGVLSGATLVNVTEEKTEETILYKEDFEEFTADEIGKRPSGYVNRNSSTAASLTIEGDDTNKYLQVAQTAKPFQTQWFSKNLDNLYTGTIEVDFDMTLGGNGGFFMLTDTNGAMICQVDFRYDGACIAVDNGGNGGVIPIIDGAYEAKKYNIKIGVNTVTKKYTISIDGSLPKELTFRENATGIGGYRVGIPGSTVTNTVQYDNFVIKGIGDEYLVGAADVAKSIKNIDEITQEQTSITMPLVPDGYTVAIKSSSDESVIDTDGNITRKPTQQEVSLVFEVTKTSDGTTALTDPISVIVGPVKSIFNELTLTNVTVNGATAQISVNADEQNPVNFVLIIAAYNDGNLISTKSVVKNNMTSSETVSVATDTVDNATSYKAFLWNSIESAKPIRESVEQNVN